MQATGNQESVRVASGGPARRRRMKYITNSAATRNTPLILVNVAAAARIPANCQRSLMPQYHAAIANSGE